MKDLIFIAFVLAIFFVICVRILSKKNEPTYIKKTGLLTPSERSFFGVIEQIINNKARIFCKVRIADIMDISGIKNKRSWWKAFSKISQKHIDFIICSKDDFSFYCAIELNDKSHNKEERKQRDEFIRKIFISVGLPLIEINTSRQYRLSELKEIIYPKLPKEISSELINLTSPPPEPIRSVRISDPDYQGGESDYKICPSCNAMMVKRKSTKGAFAGKEFFGCSKFPRCKEIIEI